jgi:putative ABC transport system ATP-binding protein
VVAAGASPAPKVAPEPAPGPGSVPTLDARDLYRFFHAGDEEVLALRGVSLAVAPGEFVALVGPSGSGKSTLLSCVAGLDDPDGGVVRIQGERLSRRPESERSRLRGQSIGILLQSGNLLEHLTVIENIRLVQSFRGRYSRSPEQLLDAVGLRHRAAATPTMLSGGEAARAGLATALARDPALLLADEPTAEVDAANEAALIELLAAEARRGMALVVATHSETLSAAAARVVRLSDGMVVGG